MVEFLNNLCHDFAKLSIGDEKCVKVLIRVIVYVSLLYNLLHFVNVYSTVSQLQFTQFLYVLLFLLSKLTHQELSTSLCILEEFFMVGSGNLGQHTRH